MSHERFRVAVIAAAFLVAAVVFVRFPAAARPAAIPFFERLAVAFFLPVTSVIVLAVFRRVAAADALRGNYARFRGTFEIMLDLAVIVIVGLQLVLHALLIIFRGARQPPRLEFVLTMLLGLALIVAGNVLPRLRPNSALGIRTPWTLGDERVWARVHRVGGRLIAAFGLAFLAVTFIDFQKVWWVAIPGLVLTLAGLPILSFVLWKSRSTES